MNARVWAFWFGVDVWPKVAGRGGESVAPPDGSGVEDKVLFWAGINGGGVGAAVGLAGRILGRAAGDDFEA